MRSIVRINRGARNTFLLAFFGVYILSNAVFIMFNSTSLASGMITGIFFLCSILLIINKKKTTNINKKYFTSILCIYILLFLQTIFSIILYGSESIVRSILSFILMILASITAPFFVNLAIIISEESFNKTIKSSYKFMTILGVASIILQKLNILYGKDMIIFKEPSHYALIYLPLVLYTIYFSKRNQKNLCIIIGLLLSIVIQNLTLLLGILFIFILSYWKNKRKLLAGIIILFTSFISNLEKLSYFKDRLSISLSSRNLSVLSWVSGWERAYVSFFDSYGFGVGFQRMGFVGEKGNAMNLIYEIMGGSYLNLYDGSSLAPKIITETGILGITLLIIYLFYFVRILRLFLNNKINNHLDVFFSAIYILFSVQLFIRGVGYFSPSAFMFSASLYWVLIRNIKLIHTKAYV